MKKIFILCIIFLLLSCSKTEQVNDLYIKNAQNETLYLHFDLEHLSTYLSSQGRFEIISNAGHNFENEQNKLDLYSAIYSFIKHSVP